MKGSWGQDRWSRGCRCRRVSDSGRSGTRGGATLRQCTRRSDRVGRDKGPLLVGPPFAAPPEQPFGGDANLVSQSTNARGSMVP